MGVFSIDREAIAETEAAKEEKRAKKRAEKYEFADRLAEGPADLARAAQGRAVFVCLVDQVLGEKESTYELHLAATIEAVEKEGWALDHLAQVWDTTLVNHPKTTLVFRRKA